MYVMLYCHCHCKSEHEGEWYDLELGSYFDGTAEEALEYDWQSWVNDFCAEHVEVLTVTPVEVTPLTATKALYK